MNKIIGSIFGVLMLVSTSLSAWNELGGDSAPDTKPQRERSEYSSDNERSVASPRERDVPTADPTHPETIPTYEDKMRDKGKR